MNNWPALKIEDVSQKVHQALQWISDNDSGVWSRSEWNICSHLAGVFRERFEDFDVDVELIKHDGRRPDIVIHGRGHNENNLAVFQVKKKPSYQDIIEDLKKITETFFSEPYKYAYGIFISIGKLPDELPEFDKNKMRIHFVSGCKLITDEEWKEKYHL